MKKHLQLKWVLVSLLAWFSSTALAQSDNCSPATTYGTTCTPVAGTGVGSTTGPEDSYAAADICAATVENTVWYTFTAPTAGTYTLTFTIGACSPFNSGLQTGVLTGPCGGPYSSLNCGFMAANATTSYTFVATAGQQVWVVADGDGGDECTFTMEICGAPCAADAGTITVEEDGVAAASPVYLCANTTNCIDLISNNDYVLPVAQPGEVAELFYALYTCPPTTSDPATDPCYSGSLWSSQDFTDCNPSTYGLTGTFYFVPITADDGDDGGDPNGVINYDQNGDACFDLGTPIQITYLNPITFGTPAENCYNGNVTIQIDGGMPEEDGSNYTITNTGAGSIVPIGVSHGNSVTITGLSDGDSYSIAVTDSEGCATVFAGGTYTACACPSINFTGLPATLSCEDAAVTLLADQGSLPTGAAITPCYYVQVFPTNAQADNLINFIEDGTNVGCFGPACAGGPVGANSNFTGYLSFASPGASNEVELCEGTAGQDMTYAIFDCHSGALISSGTWVSDGACQTVTVTPPTLSGTSSFSGTGISMSTDWGSGLFDPAAAGPGTHTITYSWDNGAGCSGTAQQSITVTNPHDATYTYPASVFCTGDADPTPTITGESGGVFTATSAGITLNGSSGVIDLSASVPGTYGILYTTPGTAPCFDTLTQFVTINPDQDGSFTYAQAAYCVNDVDPAPAITGTVGGMFTAPAQVSIDASTGVIDLSTSTVGGPYTITYTTAGPCAAVGTFNVTINALDDPSFSYGAGSYCESDGVTSPTVTGLAGGAYSFAVVAGGPALDVNTASGQITPGNSDFGTYDVTYTTNGPCPQSSTVQVVILPDEDGTFSYPSATYCADETDPAPSIAGTAGGTFSAPAGVTIDSNTGVIDLDASTPGGPYNVSYTTPGQCSVVGTFAVTINPLDDASFSYSAAVYCESSGATTPTIAGLSGGAFTAVVVSGGPTLDLNAVTGEVTPSTSDAGVYDITYTTNGPCPQTSTVQVEIVADDNPAFAYSSATYCSTGSDPMPIVTGLAGGTFSFGVVSGGPSLVLDGTSGAIDLDASDLGTYDVTYTTNGPCPQSLTVQVTVTLAPDASFNYTGPYCEGGAPNPTPSFGVGASAGTFNFAVVSGGPNLVFVSNATGEIDLSSSGPGVYDVTNTIAASGGCAAASSTAQVTILAQDDPAFDYVQDTVCLSAVNPVATIAGATGGTFSEASGGVVFVSAATGEIDLSATPAGTYTIQYLTAGACPDSTTQNITLISDDDPSFSYPQMQYCLDGVDPVANVAGVSGGTFTATPSGLSINAADGAIDLDASVGNTTYTITYTTSGICPASSTFMLTLDSIDNASITYPASVICALDPNVSATILGLTGGVFSEASGSISFVSTSTGEIDVANSTPGGPYTIVYTTGGVCPAVATFDVSITNALDATIIPVGPFCSNDPMVVLQGADAGGTWSGTGVDASGNFDPATASLGLNMVIYTIPGNCGDADTIDIQVEQFVDATITSAPASVCEGTGDVTLTAVDAGTWSGAGITDPVAGTWSPTVAGGAGSYTVYHTTAGNCGGVDSAVIVVDPVPGAPVASNVVSCIGDTVPALSAVGGGGTFNWYDDAAGTNLVGTGGSFDAGVALPGVYTYYVQEVLGNCEGPLTSVTLTITGPVAAFTATPTAGEVPFTVNFTNLSAGAVAYEWNFGDGSALDNAFEPSHEYTELGNYIVTLTAFDTLGCANAVTFTFIDADATSEISVPNVFSPNRDGENDLFMVESTNLIVLRGTIYNRWGQKMYEWEGPDGSWDGYTSAGIVAPEGTYFYVITAEGADGNTYEFQGDVTLLR